VIGDAREIAVIGRSDDRPQEELMGEYPRSDEEERDAPPSSAIGLWGFHRKARGDLIRMAGFTIDGGASESIRRRFPSGDVKSE